MRWKEKKGLYEISDAELCIRECCKERVEDKRWLVYCKGKVGCKMKIGREGCGIDEDDCGNERK